MKETPKAIDCWLWQAPISVVIAMISLNTMPAMAHNQVGSEFATKNIIHGAVFLGGLCGAACGVLFSLARHSATKRRMRP